MSRLLTPGTIFVEGESDREILARAGSFTCTL